MTSYQKTELLKIASDLKKIDVDSLTQGIYEFLYRTSERIKEIVDTRTNFNGFVNEETNYAYELLAPKEYEMEKGYTVETLADKLADVMTEEVESSSFSGGMARDLAEQFIEAVNFEEVADMLLADKAEGQP